MRDNVTRQQLERIESLKKQRGITIAAPSERTKEIKHSRSKTVVESPPTLTPSSSKGSSRDSLPHSSSKDKKKDKDIDHADLIKELSYLCARGETRRVKSLVTKMLKNPSKYKLHTAVDSNGMNILHLAVEGCPDLIKLLVEKKMDINKR